MDKKLSQREQVEAHLLEYGSITPLRALHEYGCFRLASVICRLRKSGMAIVTGVAKQENGNIFADYWLRNTG